MSPFTENIRRFLLKHSLHETPGILAVSGGPDSLALAAAMSELNVPTITIGHFNHQLRGADSDGDEAFVQSFAAEANLPFVVGHAAVAEEARDSRTNIEDAARTARYRWLAETARQFGAAWIATGHTADDQAETILHHFLRGTGIRGLAGMPEVRELEAGVSLIRPMLALRRSDVVDYLAERNLAPRHDATNDDTNRTRSRLRHETLPSLSADYNPRLVEVLGRLGEQCREMQILLDGLAADLLSHAELPRAGDMCIVRAATIADAPPIVAAEAFRGLWRREGWPMGEMNYDDWRHLVAFAHQSNGARDFPGLIHIRRIGAVLQLSCHNHRDPS
jgi:tRNA(Ile)-lysidine synthase